MRSRIGTISANHKDKIITVKGLLFWIVFCNEFLVRWPPVDVFHILTRGSSVEYIINAVAVVDTDIINQPIQGIVFEAP